MLWNIVFEFYVKYIFGGRLIDNQVFNGALGMAFDSNGNWSGYPYTSTVMVYDLKVGNNVYSFPLGNYLSLIATIITMVVILVLCCMFIKKIYNMCSHIIG